MRRPPPRVRKRRIRAFANRLRARFGNDRFLAHKLIGGLALLALLPVLNMVLVPGKDLEETVSGFRVPVSGEQRDGAIAGSGENPVAGGFEEQESAQDAPPTADQPGNKPTGEPDSAVGAASSRDERGPDTRIAAANSRPARKPETGNRKPAPAALYARSAR